MEFFELKKCTNKPKSTGIAMLRIIWDTNLIILDWRRRSMTLKNMYAEISNVEMCQNNLAKVQLLFPPLKM